MVSYRSEIPEGQDISDVQKGTIVKSCSMRCLVSNELFWPIQVAGICGIVEPVSARKGCEKSMDIFSDAS